MDWMLIAGGIILYFGILWFVKYQIKFYREQTQRDIRDAVQLVEDNVVRHMRWGVDFYKDGAGMN